MAGVRFYTKKYKDVLQIFFSLTYKRGHRLRYYTGWTIPPDYWDDKTHWVTPPARSQKYHNLIPSLQELADEAERIQHRYENQTPNSKSLLTNDIFKEELDRFLKKSSSKDDSLTFFGFFENFIRKREANHKYAKGSITIYRNTLLKVQEFGSSKHKKLDFHSFNEDFFKDFTEFLFKTPKDSKRERYSNNYVHKITSLRSLSMTYTGAPDKSFLFCANHSRLRFLGDFPLCNLSFKVPWAVQAVASVS